MVTVSYIRTHSPGGPFIYVGRRNFTYSLPGSLYANPFPLKKEADRLEVYRDFAAYWYDPRQAWLRAQALLDIPNSAVLLCWCHGLCDSRPKLCHADIVAGYLNAKRYRRFEETYDPCDY